VNAEAKQETIPDLETLCPECEGTRGSRYLGEFTECLECEGAGYIPTESGKKIVTLLRHNFRPMLAMFTGDR
jgi:Tryptophan RNA-binding attenuator protein inhibitory protein